MILFFFKSLLKKIFVNHTPSHINPPKIPSQKINISVVIPTYNSATTIERLLTSIKKQQHVNTQIIIVDSGSSDQTIEIAKKHTAEIFPIPHTKFNHGLSRNLGINKSKYNYVFMTVQDAVIESSLTFIHLANHLSNDHQLLSVSAKQTPSENADAFAFFENISLYNSPRKNFIDDVAVMINKTIFKELGEYHQVPYGEDFELSNRLSDKYKAILCPHLPVTHSHVRPPEYFLKRYYLGTKTVLQNNSHPNPKPSEIFRIIYTATILLENINIIIESLSFPQILTCSEKKITHQLKTTSLNKSNDILFSLLQFRRFSHPIKPEFTLFHPVFYIYIDGLYHHSSQRLAPLENKKVFLEKIIYMQCGKLLAEYSNSSIKLVQKIEKLLSEGV